jgi:hypothetical protein
MEPRALAFRGMVQKWADADNTGRRGVGRGYQIAQQFAQE